MALTQVSTEGIKNGTITNADLASNAAIDSSKINTSGLDADTLDGVQGSSFLRSDANDSASGTLSLNGRVNIGDSLTRPSALNSDANAACKIGGGDVHLYIASLGQGGGYKVAMQAARDSDFSSFTLNLQANGGALQRGGNTVWDAGTDGAGSGLDADLLDGVQGSSYLRSDADDTLTGDLTLNGRLIANEGSPPATGYNHFISDDGSATTIGTAATLRVANNGGNAAYSVFEAESGSGSVRLANDGQFYVTGNAKFSNRVRTDISSSVDGFMGEAYSGYFGLKHTDQTLNSEYMILSQDSHTFISASTGSSVYIRAGGNSNTNEMIVSTSGTTIGGNLVLTTANEGSGNGLDADKLDGVEGASFLRSDANDSASGQLTFSNKVIIDHNNDPMLEIKPVNSGPWAISINRDDLSSSKVFAHDPNSQGVGWVFEHCPYILIDSNYRKVAITSTNNIIGYSPNFPAGSAENIKDAVSGTPDNGWYWIQQFGNVARLHYCVFKDKNGSDIAGGPWTMNWVAGVFPNQFSTNGSTALGQYLNLCKGIGIDKPGRGMESSRTTSQVYGAWLAVKRALWDLDPGFFNDASSGSGGVLIMPLMNINGEGGSSAHRLVYSTGTSTHIPPNQDGDHCNANQLFCGWWGGNDFSSWATDNNSVPSPEDWGPGDSAHTGNIGARSNSTQQKPSWKDLMLVTCIYK